MQSALPSYDHQLSAFHRAFERELGEILDALPLAPRARVLDLACGDGFYSRRIAERLGPGGLVVASDLSLAYLAKAGEETARAKKGGKSSLVAASFDRLPFPDGTFDLVWCAQSLYSLPDPALVLRHMARMTRPGGHVAILENDTMHQVFLPWPARLEAPLRAAELQSFRESTASSSKFYVGRRLPALLADAGLAPVRMNTHAFDRQAPLGEAERELLQSYLEEVEGRVQGHLDVPLREELRRLVHPGSPQHLLKQPYLTMTWVNVVAIGRLD